MSGHKRRFISITEAEYRRLHDADMKQRSQANRSSQRIPSVSSTGEQAMWAQLNESRRRQEWIDQSLHVLDGSLSAFEHENSRRLMEIEDAMLQRLRGSVDAANSATTHQIAGLTGWIDQVFSEYQNQVDTRIAEMISAQNDRDGRNQYVQDSAHYWIQASEQIFGIISEAYEIENIFPGETDNINGQIDQARRNLESGLAEAAVVQAQGTYRDLSDLRFRLEQVYQEYTYYWNTANEMLDDFNCSLEQSSFCPAMDLSGQLLPTQLNIDYWTSGGLTNLSEIGVNLRQFLDRTNYRDTAGLLGLIDHEIPELSKRLNDLIYQARWEALSSQLRINIAELAVHALEGQGFDLVDAAYSNKDQRNAFSAWVLDYGGSEVQITVEPVPGIYVGNELHIISKDADSRTQHELERRDLEIQRAINQYGLVVQAGTGTTASVSYTMDSMRINRVVKQQNRER